jgi:hypothetical protein
MIPQFVVNVSDNKGLKGTASYDFFGGFKTI